MCNSSFSANDSALLIRKDLSWFCMCQEHFGPVVIVFISILSIIVGTPIHCWSLWMFLCGNIKPNIIFPLNITILELLFSLLCFADLIDFKYSSMVSYNIATFIIGVCWTARPLLQICICIEQYMAVIHPVTFLRYKGIQYKITLVAAAWLTAVGNGFRLVFFRTTYFRDHVFFCIFCIAVTITSYCCVSVRRALESPGPGDHKNVEMTEKDRHHKTNRGRAVENQQKRKAFKIISHILVSILICYLPLVVAYFMCIAEYTLISTRLLICEIVPLILSISVIGILISPLVRMYDEGQLKHIVCFSKLRGQIRGN